MFFCACSASSFNNKQRRVTMSNSRPPIRGYIDPNFPNPNQPGDASIIIYGYTPSFILAILGCVLFLVALVAHVVQLVKFRTWYFSTMVVGIAFVRHFSFSSFSLDLQPCRVVASNLRILCHDQTTTTMLISFFPIWHRKSSVTPFAFCPPKSRPTASIISWYNTSSLLWRPCSSQRPSIPSYPF